MAISYDNALANSSGGPGGSGNTTWPFTVGASCTRIDAICWANSGSGYTINSVKLGTTSFSLRGTVTNGSWTAYFYCLVNPTTGAGTITVNSSVYRPIEVSFESYNGTSTTLPSNFIGNTATLNNTDFTTTLTTLTDNSWTALSVIVPATGDTISARTGTTARGGSGGGGAFIGDSNGVVHPAGSKSMAVKTGGTDTLYSLMVEVQPATGGGAPKRRIGSVLR